MNKYKKIATAVVATAMAGTMVFSLTACGKKGDKNTDNRSGVEKIHSYLSNGAYSVRERANATGWTTAKGYWNYLKTNASAADAGAYDYTAATSRANVTLNMATGHEKLETGISYNKVGTTITLPDGKNYTNGDLKPAWVQMGNDLNITFNNIWHGEKTSNNLDYLTGGTAEAGKGYADTDLFTSDLSKVISNVAKGTSVLNLADYLDQMPHFKAFLESNPIVYLSLLQAGWDTSSTTSKQVLYVAPYFDGNDDIERYCLIRQDWADKILNGSTALANSGKKFSETSSKVAVESFMGTTGTITVDALTADGSATTKIVKDYNAAKTAAQTETTALGAAYKAIAGGVYTGESGNIVDIMSAALKANMDATGSQLATLYRAYIDVAYKTEAGAAFYAADKRSNLFNGYDAAWDVDDLVAMLRCVRTNGANITSATNVLGIVPRSGQNDRTPDVVRLAANLYGIRGMESRYEYTYIDNNGNLKDARNNIETYEALERMNTLTQEGLVANYSGYANFKYEQATKDKKNTDNAFMMYDYSQTQTANGFFAENDDLSGTDVDDDYYFGAVLNPVSKWDVNADGTIAANEIFRFTESWRSTKTGGLAVNGKLANAGNEAKLTATLQFIDYLYSEDGQIVSTYGPKASDANGTGGFWYNEEATPAQVTAGQYFTYKGVKYAGTEYKGRYTPTVTTALYNSFLGKTKLTTSAESDVASVARSFTNYARKVIGSTLPIGVKDQSFENQLTSKMGAEAAGRVGVALSKGIVKGLTLEINENNWWYTCVPTSLPVASDLVNGTLNADSQKSYNYMTGTAKGSSKDFLSIFNYIILYGTTGTYNEQDVVYNF